MTIPSKVVLVTMNTSLVLKMLSSKQKREEKEKDKKIEEELEVTFLLRFDNLAPRSVLVIKFACVNLALKTSVANSVNPEVSIYFS